MCVCVCVCVYVCVYTHIHMMHIYIHVYTHTLLHRNLMVNTNQKSVIDLYTKKIKRNPNITLKIVIKSPEKTEKV